MAQPNGSSPLPDLVEAAIRVSPQPNFAVGAFGSLWVTVGDGTVARIDPNTNKVTDSIRVGGEPGAIVAGAGNLWVGNYASSRLTKIDPRSETVAARVHLPGAVYGLAFGFGSVWASGEGWQGFVRLDPHSNKVIARGHSGGSDIALGFGSLWVTDSGNGISRLSPHNLSVEARIKTRTSVHTLGVGAGGVWGSTGDAGDFVFHIDPASNTVAATIKTDDASFPDRIAFSKGVAWVGEFQSATVLGIDPRKNAIIRHLKVGDGPAVVIVAFGSLWVDNYNSDSVWRVPLPVPGD
jgi:YVTN family beta-propeller protein